MRWHKGLRLHDFLSKNPNLRLERLSDSEAVLTGEYELNAQFPGYETISDTYSLKVVIPRGFPKSIPVVYEQSAKFPRLSDYHTYDDGSLCLGSTLKLKLLCMSMSEVSEFFEEIIVPYLYSIAYKLKYSKIPFGELAHGESGLIDDYQKILEVDGKSAVLNALKVLGMKPRHANKVSCPCQCGTRLGKCSYRHTINQYRSLASRRWFRQHLSKNFSELPDVSFTKKTKSY